MLLNTMETYNLTHLKALEAEAIHIIREVAAEFRNPVMLYSIGKDSSVMVRLAEKAFYPGRVPFPLMHIDSKWKFREMIEFRDRYAAEHNWNLIVEYNRKAYEEGVGPFTHGSKVHTDLMKTQALLMALKKHGFDAAFGGARRDEEKSSATNSSNGIPRTNAPNYGIYTIPASARGKVSGSSRSRIGRSWISGSISARNGFPSCHSTTPRSAPSSR